jgi:hypothetical protein
MYIFKLPKLKPKFKLDQMNFYFKFYDIQMREKKPNHHDYNNLKW